MAARTDTVICHNCLQFGGSFKTSPNSRNPTRANSVNKPMNCAQDSQVKQGRRHHFTFATFSKSSVKPPATGLKLVKSGLLIFVEIPNEISDFSTVNRALAARFQPSPFFSHKR